MSETDVAAELDLPNPWDVSELCRIVGERLGCRIVLVPWPFANDGLSACVISSDARSAIFYRTALTGWHRDHVICHELGHLLAGHVGLCVPGSSEDEQAERIGQLIIGRARLAADRMVSGFASAMA